MLLKSSQFGLSFKLRLLRLRRRGRPTLLNSKVFGCHLFKVISFVCHYAIVLRRLTTYIATSAACSRRYLLCHNGITPLMLVHQAWPRVSNRLGWLSWMATFQAPKLHAHCLKRGELVRTALEWPARSDLNETYGKTL